MKYYAKARGLKTIAAKPRKSWSGNAWHLVAFNSENERNAWVSDGDPSVEQRLTATAEEFTADEVDQAEIDLIMKEVDK